MPFICIGPVCIPWSALIPLLCYLARPVWSRLHPDTQSAFIGRYKAYQDWMQLNLWDRVGWKAKRDPLKRPPSVKTTDSPPPPADPAAAAAAAAAAATAATAATAASLRAQLGSVVALQVRQPP